VILTDQSDADSIFSETQDSPEKSSPVIWCSYEDAFYFYYDEDCKYNATI